MNCPKCNAENDEDSEFCSSCGERIIQPDSPNNSTSETDSQIIYYPKTRTLPKKGLLIGLTFLIISIIVIVAASFGPLSDFSVSIESSEGTVLQGQIIESTISVDVTSGSSQTVVLSVSGPSGVNFNLNPQSGKASYDSHFTINVPSGLKSGSYTITVTGSGGGKTHTCTYTLNVLSANVAVSGTVKTVGFATYPTSIAFKDLKTGEVYETSALGNSYSLMIPNQANYRVTCYYKSSLTGVLWTGSFEAGTVNINCGIGQSTMTLNFEG